MLSLSDMTGPACCPHPFNLAAHVLGQADINADKTALEILSSTHTDHWSYARLKQAVLGTGSGLLKLGLSPGDRVLMRLGNTVEFPIAYLGAIAVGLIPVPTSSQLTEREVAGIIKTVCPSVILLAPEVACPTGDIPTITRDMLSRMHNLPVAEWNMGHPDRPAYIIYTSGTSGTPRAVVHAHRAIWARQMMFDGWYGLQETDRLMHAGAFNWTYTLGTGLMDPWTRGATALIPAPGTMPQQLPQFIQDNDTTIFAAAPGVYRKFLTSDSTLEFPTLRHGLSAGEKLSDTIRTNWKHVTGTPIYEAYGMSECSTFISGCPDHPAKSGTLGRPQPGRRIALIGANGPVPLGTEGTIAVHHSDPGLMLEYLGAPTATADKMQGDWFLTGDQGLMDAAGNITYLGRSDDMMNAGGFRVSPMEVEAVLNTHPDITQAIVTDIEVKQDARVIMAFYTSDAPIKEDVLNAFATDRMADYKRPRGWYRLEHLPSGANGKLLRRALQPIYEVLNDQS